MPVTTISTNLYIACFTLYNNFELYNLNITKISSNKLSYLSVHHIILYKFLFYVKQERRVSINFRVYEPCTLQTQMAG